MHFSTLLTGIVALVAKQALGAAIQFDSSIAQNPDSSVLEARTLSCSGSIPHLSQADCQHLAKLGFDSHGVNANTGSGTQPIWIGTDGKYKAVFENTSGKDIILVAWNEQFSYSSSFVQSNQARITATLADKQSITLSFGDSMSGAWSAIYPNTQLHLGQVGNTWGEFTTGDYATVDVSREVNMGGTPMSIKTPQGCTSNMDQCVFVCNSGSTCGTAGSYTLKNCSGPHGSSGNGGTSGGCMGWPSGALKVTLGA